VKSLKRKWQHEWETQNTVEQGEIDEYNLATRFFSALVNLPLHSESPKVRKVCSAVLFNVWTRAWREAGEEKFTTQFGQELNQFCKDQMIKLTETTTTSSTIDAAPTEAKAASGRLFLEEVRKLCHKAEMKFYPLFANWIDSYENLFTTEENGVVYSLSTDLKRQYRKFCGQFEVDKEEKEEEAIMEMELFLSYIHGMMMIGNCEAFGFKTSCFIVLEKKWW